MAYSLAGELQWAIPKRAGVVSAMIVLTLVMGGCRSSSTSGSVNVAPDSVVAKTVVAGIGSVIDFQSFSQAQSILGWRVLRPSGAAYTLVQHGGDLRTFPEVGLPRIEQFYSVAGHNQLLEFYQEPDAYKETPLGGKA